MKINLVDLPILEQINTPNGRFYKTPEGNTYPSVTSLLGQLNNEHLSKWRASVGDLEADRISKKAADRGTLIHSCCEEFILNGKLTYKFDMFELDAELMFKNMVPHIEEFDEVLCLEQRVYSDKLKAAGTIDCVANINGDNYLVDFKTSSRLKSRDEISSYFMQTAAYAMMFYERTGIIVPNIRIIMTTVSDGVLIFDENFRDWIGKFIELTRKK